MGGGREWMNLKNILGELTGLGPGLSVGCRSRRCRE